MIDPLTYTLLKYSLLSRLHKHFERISDIKINFDVSYFYQGHITVMHSFFMRFAN